MKKLLLLGLTLAMAFTMAACGGGDDKSSAEDAAKKAVEQAEEFESFSVEAVEHYLKSAVNMELTSVAPDWEYTIGEKSAYADDPSSGEITGRKLCIHRQEHAGRNAEQLGKGV